MATANRRHSVRSSRTSTARPANYYATFPGYGPPEDQQPAVQHGFYPAITYFTDAISALPKEIQRHFTTLKESEGKAFPADEAITHIVDRINRLPTPPLRPATSHTQALLGFSLTASVNASVNGSAPSSVIDGVVPTKQPESISQAPVDEHLETRRRVFMELREVLRPFLAILDEKSMVLSATNETLARQLSRLTTSIPHIENEISEEARLGSLTHWALPHMKEARRVATHERSRRDVQSANNLAAAAAAVHEHDIAAIRSEARREAMLSRRRGNVDSDFDERPAQKRSHQAKKKLEAQDAKSAPPTKRRRVEKPSAVGMERSLSAAINGRLPAVRDALEARDGGAGDARRKPKPAQPPKKRFVESLVHADRRTANSPPIASSPTRGTFPMKPPKEQSPAPIRPGSARGRQNSAASVKTISELSKNRPLSASSLGKNGRVGTPEVRNAAQVAGRTAGEARSAITDSYPLSNGDIAIEQEGVNGVVVVEEQQPWKHEDAEPADKRDSAQDPSAAPAFGSAPAPAAEPAESAMMTRTRSGRGTGNGNGAGARHSAASSPALGSVPMSRASTRQPQPRRSPMGEGRDQEPAPVPGPPEPASVAAALQAQPDVLEYGAAGPAAPNDDDDAASSAASDEPRYCFCNQPSYGSMVACDNAKCPHEWFHLECVGLSEEPPENTKWYCNDCKKTLKRSRSNGNGAVR